jgi:6-pyruvoyltetrahydropterin/6-carboxytetrahydropterin synthase
VTQLTYGAAKNVTSSSATNVGSPQASTSIESSLQSIPQVGISITKTFQLISGHHLPYHEGKCRYPHGHNYKIEVTAEGHLQAEGSSKGMIRDFADIGDDFESLFGTWDHYTTLNQHMDNPTAENMAVFMLLHLRNKDTRYTKVTVYETDTCSATAQITRQ